MKYEIGKKYEIGNNYITISKGSKPNANDYILKWNGTMQFDDKMLFDLIYMNIDTEDKAQEFINNFIGSGFVTLEKQCIKTKIDNIEDVVSYVNSLYYNDNLKMCLASMLLRCDIDNINYYPCPPFNGCVRHFIQVVMVLGYKFNIINWKMEKLKNANTEIIYNIGHPNNYNITKEDFKNMYMNNDW